MVSQPNTFAHINGNILGIAGYYTDNTSTQHVIVATTDGNLYEVHWSKTTPVTVSKSFAHFNGLTDVAGFYSPDDNNEHALVATNDGNLHEVFFTQPESVHTRSPLTYVGDIYPANGMAGYYSPGDTLRHAVIMNNEGNPVDITFNALVEPHAIEIKTPYNKPDVASISGFVSADDSYRHIIMALTNTVGEVIDISYPDEQHVPANLAQGVQQTNFNERVVNVTAFYGADTKYRHIVALTVSGLLYDHAYSQQGDRRSTQLTSAPIQNIADITSYYTVYDQVRHVIIATKDGYLHEITYTSQG